MPSVSTASALAGRSASTASSRRRPTALRDQRRQGHVASTTGPSSSNTRRLGNDDVGVATLTFDGTSVSGRVAILGNWVTLKGEAD